MKATGQKESVRVSLFHGRPYEFMSTGSLKGFSDKLLEILQEIPEQWQDSARIDILSYDDYGGHYASVEIDYWRDETDDELHARESSRLRQEDSANREEILQLKKLQAKYPDIGK